MTMRIGTCVLTILFTAQFAAAQPPAPPAGQPFAAGPAAQADAQRQDLRQLPVRREPFVRRRAGPVRGGQRRHGAGRGPNDGYVSLINPDGTAHTLKWIGVNRNGLTLNHPLGSDIANGMLYVVDIDTVRWFDMKTGEPHGQRRTCPA